MSSRAENSKRNREMGGFAEENGPRKLVAHQPPISSFQQDYKPYTTYFEWEMASSGTEMYHDMQSHYPGHQAGINAGEQSPPLIPTASPIMHHQHNMHGVHSSPHSKSNGLGLELLSPSGQAQFCQGSSPSQSIASTMTGYTPSLSSGTMSTSSSQDCFSPLPAHSAHSPMILYPANFGATSAIGSPHDGMYFPSTQYQPSTGKSRPQATKTSSTERIFIHPTPKTTPSPNMIPADASAASRSTTSSSKGKSREAAAKRASKSVNSVMGEPHRKGKDLGLDLGDFEMGETLGTGTFGKVILAKLRRSPSRPAQTESHYFAMKVLAKMTVVRLRQVEHLNSERATLAHVSHPFIVNLFCTFQDERNLYLLLEYIQGGELFSHLRRAGRFTADVTRFYIANLVLALEYLHSKEIIYRDLKPENLLIDSNGYLKITDFGFAKHVTDRTYTLCGTPEYLAPEIITATGHGSAADWWALGVLLFELMAGFPPFFADSPLEIYERILKGHINFPPHFDYIAKDLIKRLLTADLSKRLGNLRGGAQDIKNHAWFEGVDWLAVERKEIRAPIIPGAASASDTSNFERYPPTVLEDLPAIRRAHEARKFKISPSNFAKGPDEYGYLFGAF